MKNITDLFKEIYVPAKALLLYRCVADESSVYVEAYDTDSKGCLINAHPLSLIESEMLADTLHCSQEMKKDFLKSKGLLPHNVLYIDAGKNGYAVWYTPPRAVSLFFKEDLGIPNGTAHVPAMVWKANKKQLSVFALKDSKKPTIKTALYHAPFFNIHTGGSVCMGTVDIDIESNCCLETFMQQWEDYFFKSKFSHLLDSYNPVGCNIVQLWQQQVKDGGRFPVNELIKNGKTVKSLLQ